MQVAEIFTTGTRVTGGDWDRDHDRDRHRHHRGHWRRRWHGWYGWRNEWCWDD
jgi:hypothetical protein